MGDGCRPEKDLGNRNVVMSFAHVNIGFTMDLISVSEASTEHRLGERDRQYAALDAEQSTRFVDRLVLRSEQIREGCKQQVSEGVPVQPGSPVKAVLEELAQ
jgi:hypothetical protein